MNPLLLTIAFLMFFGAIVTTEVKKFVQDSSSELFYSHHKELRALSEMESAESIFNAIKAVDAAAALPEKKERKPSKNPKPKNPKSPTLDFNLACPPDNARLNLALLFSSEQEEEAQSLYEIAAELMKRLYGHTSFFRTQAKLEYKILDELFLLKEQTNNFKSPEDLASLLFKDVEVGRAFAMFLRGGFDDEGKPLPPFVNFLTFEHTPHGEAKKINLMFASTPLLEAIFKNPEVVKDLERARGELWKIIVDQEEHRLEREAGECFKRGEIKKLLNASFENALTRAHLDIPSYKSIFDFTLGHQGTVVLVKDPKTGMTMRNKISSPLKKEEPNNS